MDFKVHSFGDPESDTLLLQMVDGRAVRGERAQQHDPEGIIQEAAYIREMTGGQPFCLKAVEVNSWNHDLSPWPAEAVFGKEGFGEGAADTLDFLLKDVLGNAGSYRKICLGGYSLAGLFALWAGYQTDVFSGIAAASPSVWFPHFTEYMQGNRLLADAVYLSLGDREEKTRNPVMARVGAAIRSACTIIKNAGKDCILEWNEGNHFREPDLRTAKAFSWLMKL